LPYLQSENIALKICQEVIRSIPDNCYPFGKTGNRQTPSCPAWQGCSKRKPYAIHEDNGVVVRDCHDPEDGGMNNKTMSRLASGIVLTLLCSLAGCTTLARNNPLGLGNSWKEEVLLHDGTTLIAKRSQSYGGYPTIDSSSRALREEEWEFTIPGTKQKVMWKNDGRRPPEGTSLTLIMLDFRNGIPYIATYPAGCISYNYWGRPNPPYVFFKHDGTSWQRIAMEEFPSEFKAANVIIGRPDETHRSGILSATTVMEENRHLEPYLRVFVREPVDPKNMDCGEMVYDGNGGWIGLGWFRKQPSYEACLDVCARNKMSPQYCPCDELFNKSEKEKK
jgi:hypothetical protein